MDLAALERACMSFAYRAEVEAMARMFGLDADLVQAVCEVESSGKTHAYRFEPGFWTRYLQDKPEWDGANPERVSASYGLMQCMYPVAKELGYHDLPEHLFAPLTGLHWGCKKLRTLIDWAGGDIEQALAAYNGGMGGNSKRPFRNQSYVNKVQRQLTRIREAVSA